MRGEWPQADWPEDPAEPLRGWQVAVMALAAAVGWLTVLVPALLVARLLG